MNKKIHFVGIGGIGVSSLARHYIAKGCIVSGSDENDCDDLKEEGATVFKGHHASNVPMDAEILIYSSAVSKENPEIRKAEEIGITVKTYPEALGEITKKYFTIGVSGTHGKSTTTGMLATVMIKAGLDPTVIIGTKMKEFGDKNYRKGNSKYLLIEADEHKRALLNYSPKLVIITNIEEDHLDYYKDIEDILSTFQNYIENNLKEGTLILNEGDKNTAILKKRVRREKVISYSKKEELIKKSNLSVPGDYNLENALGVFKAGIFLGIDKSLILEGLKEFKGTWRRFEEEDLILENGKKIKVINDYAHHPTAVKVTLEAVKEKYPKKKIVTVFQPHQYERTYRLFSSFVETLSNVSVDTLIITDIYTVKGRESEEITKKVSADKLAKEVKNAIYTGDIQKTKEYLIKNLRGGEILVIMGAGDVYRLGGYIKKVTINH